MGVLVPVVLGDSNTDELIDAFMLGMERQKLLNTF